MLQTAHPGTLCSLLETSFEAPFGAPQDEVGGC